jgi:hypothetical protein
MRTTRSGAALAGVLTIASIALSTPAASAASPKCVSKKEFRAVRDGWSITRVYNKFDITGKMDWYTEGYDDPEFGWPDAQGRSYRACTQFGTVYVDYERVNGKWRVTSKSAYW